MIVRRLSLWAALTSASVALVAGASSPSVSAHSVAAPCGSVAEAEQSARARLDAFFAAIRQQRPAAARSVLALHRKHPERYRLTLSIWHAKHTERVSHSEITYRSSVTDNRAFDTWVGKRKRAFTIASLRGANVRSGEIALSVSVDLTSRNPALHYTGKAVFDCVQNRYVFLQFGREG